MLRRVSATVPISRKDLRRWAFPARSKCVNTRGVIFFRSLLPKMVIEGDVVCAVDLVEGVEIGEALIAVIVGEETRGPVVTSWLNSEMS
jgi:hypothetical protein